MTDVSSTTWSACLGRFGVRFGSGAQAVFFTDRANILSKGWWCVHPVVPKRVDHFHITQHMTLKYCLYLMCNVYTVHILIIAFYVCPMVFPKT